MIQDVSSHVDETQQKIDQLSAKVQKMLDNMGASVICVLIEFADSTSFVLCCFRIRTMLSGTRAQRPRVSAGAADRVHLVQCKQQLCGAIQCNRIYSKNISRYHMHIK
jgi:hypothetical protein